MSLSRLVSIDAHAGPQAHTRAEDLHIRQQTPSHGASARGALIHRLTRSQGTPLHVRLGLAALDLAHHLAEQPRRALVSA